MEISKLRALWALVTGGWAGLAEYVLEAVNAALKKFDATRLAQFAQVVKSVANALIALTPLLPEKYRDAANETIGSVNTLALSLADGHVTQAELDECIDQIEAAIAAWKSVK